MERIREMTGQSTMYRDAHLTVDFQRQAATLDTNPMVLTKKEFELLALLVGYAGDIVPREEQLMRVWGYSTEIRTRTLDVHIRHLRKKLGVYAERYIETIFGIGHRFQPYDKHRAQHHVDAQASRGGPDAEGAAVSSSRRPGGLSDLYPATRAAYLNKGGMAAAV